MDNNLKTIRHPSWEKLCTWRSFCGFPKPLGLSPADPCCSNLSRVEVEGLLFFLMGNRGACPGAIETPPSWSHLPSQLWNAEDRFAQCVATAGLILIFQVVAVHSSCWFVFWYGLECEAERRGRQWVLRLASLIYFHLISPNPLFITLSFSRRPVLISA